MRINATRNDQNKYLCKKKKEIAIALTNANM